MEGYKNCASELAGASEQRPYGDSCSVRLQVKRESISCMGWVSVYAPPYINVFDGSSDLVEPVNDSDLLHMPVDSSLPHLHKWWDENAPRVLYRSIHVAFNEKDLK